MCRCVLPWLPVIQSEISTLKVKLKGVEEERDVLRETENRLVDKVTQLTQQLTDAQVML